jgi:hypothetical protein
MADDKKVPMPVYFPYLLVYIVIYIILCLLLGRDHKTNKAGAIARQQLHKYTAVQSYC